LERRTDILAMNKEEILLEVKRRLEEKYGVEGGVFPEQGKVIVENVSKPNSPIHPEDVENIIKRVSEKFDLRSGDLAYSADNGNIIVSFPSN